MIGDKTELWIVVTEMLAWVASIDSAYHLDHLVLAYISTLLIHICYIISGDKTEKWIGVSEMLAGVAFMGIIFHLVAAQPLLIIGFTGPLLIFEEGLYQVWICINK